MSSDHDCGDHETSAFRVGDLVEVVGLQSEAGQKLNGGHGLVYFLKTKNGKRKEFPAGVERYPILLYALKGGVDFEIVKPKTVKSIKPQNLRLVADFHGNKVATDLYQEAFERHCADAQRTQNKEDAFFWLENYHALFPDDFQMAGNYVRLLRDVKQQYKEAWKVLKPLKKHFDPNDKQFYPVMCCDYCVTAAKAKEDLPEALEFAKKIPQERTDLATKAYYLLMQAAEEQIQQSLDPQTLDTTALASIHNACAERLCELGPSDAAENLANLGASYCLAGNQVEGAKAYRRALALHDGSSTRLTEPEHRKRNLILAQLQCPGMPLEEYFVSSHVGGDNPGVHCIHNRDRDKCRMKLTELRNGQGVLGQVEAKPGMSVTSMFFPIPKDPNDPNVFSSEFLQSLS